LRHNGGFAASLTPNGGRILARKQAAIMALLAMLVVLFRAMKDQAGFEGTMTTALIWMFLFGAIGFVVGAIAQATVDQAVLINVEAALDASAPQQQPENPPAAT
jgi:hypothetical protein